jgi:hypothetical protein
VRLASDTTGSMAGIAAYSMKARFNSSGERHS